MELYNERMEALIKAALADGVLSEKERQVLMKKATEEGIDQDEFEMVLNARVFEVQKDRAPQTVSNHVWGKNKIRMCPNCGATIGDNFLTCPECGFAFVNESSASESIRDYLTRFDEEASKINSFWKNGKKVEKITSLKVPNTKEALIQALIFCSSKYTAPCSENERMAWKSKAREFYRLIKAQPNIDSTTQQFIIQYAYLEKKGLFERLLEVLD